jgi:hypothetical protein
MRFDLKPWDRTRPRLRPPLADCVVEHGGKTFGLRAQNGLLFFRDQSDQRATWAIASPLPNEIEHDPTHFEAFWRREFERGQVARYLVHFHSYLERAVPLFLLGDGTGWCREGWNRDDIAFSHATSMHDFLEGSDEVLKGNLFDVEAQLEEKLAQMPFPDGTPMGDDGRVEWLCGSLEELERVAGWICTLETALWKPGAASVELDIATENQFARAHVDGVSLHTPTEHLWLSFYCDELTDALSLSGDGEKLPLSRRFWTLFDLALDLNTPSGIHWEYHDYGQNRTADEPHAHLISLEFARPAIEERAQARVQLRRWLAPLVPASELEALLEDDAPLPLPEHKW